MSSSKAGTSQPRGKKATAILREYEQAHPALATLLKVASLTGVVGVPLLASLRDWYSIVLVLMFAGVVTILLVANPDKEVDHRTPSELVTRQSSHRFSFLMIGLWLFGSTILLGNRIGDGTFIVWSGSEYWGLLALSSTIFALIFGFRVSRIWDRIGREDEGMLTLYAKVVAFLYRNPSGPLSRQILLDLQQLDQANLRTQISVDEWNVDNQIVPFGSVDEQGNTPEKQSRSDSRPTILSSLFFFYNRIQQQITVARTNSPKPEFEQSTSADVELEASMKDLDEIARDLNSLVHSKQQDRDVSELIALVMFATVTVVLGVLSRPPGIITASNGWTPLLMEWFLITFVSTIAFLAYSMFELRGVRDKPTLRPTRSGAVKSWRTSIGDLETFDHGTYAQQTGALWLRRAENNQVQDDLEDFRIFFRFNRELSGDRTKAIALTGAISLTFGVLLAFKWL